MALVISTPSVLRLDLPEAGIERAREFLTFHDKGVDYLIGKHKQKQWWKRDDPEGWKEAFEALKAQRNRCILFEDEKGFFTYSGLAKPLSDHLVGEQVRNDVVYPEPVGVAWAEVPEHEQRYYQDEMKSALLAARHAAVEVGTGLGKSRVILELVKELGLPAIVMAPGRSIATQLHRDFSKHLGAKYVGQYGDGKKKVGKLVTIGIGASLTKVEPGSDDWRALSRAQVFIVDESHGCPADTLERVCSGLAASAPYRFFFSATQVRNDGSDIVLAGITGPVVYRMSVKQGVEQGFLAKPLFKIIRVDSTNSYAGADVQKLTQKHLYYNPEVIRRTQELVNGVIARHGHRVLVLVDEMGQFAPLANGFKYETRFAHGGVTKENAGKLAPQYHKSDPQKLVDQFNNEEFPILVGTSCVATGTDLKACETVINLQGGRSSIAVPQAVGRGTRKFTFKSGRKKVAFNYVDFAVRVRNGRFEDGVDGLPEKKSMSPVYRHALARAEMYRDLYPSVQWL